MMVSNYADNMTAYSTSSMVEGIARVVAVQGDMALLEPEENAGCSSCASSGSCGTKSLITPSAKKQQARRFHIENPGNLRTGERVVIGISNDTLIRASVTAYIIPLAVMLLAGGLAQWLYSSDLVTVAATIVGLIAGFKISQARAKQLQSRGDLTPHYLRHARPGETCHS